jgi:ubiquinone/menaquinone biosynthesis C-methylase UbiE
VSLSKRTHKHEKLARIYDEEILPIWSHRFGRMMLRGLEFPPKAMVLDVACGTGYPALEVLRRLDEQSRLIAIDSSSAMLDVARKKAGELSGKRVFFRTESAAPRLGFANDVYDVVLCNLGLSEMPNPRMALRELTRVAKPGGRVICTLPMAGTWAEFFDIYREVLTKHDKHDMIERLDRHIQGFPQPEEVELWMANAGLGDVELDVEEFTLLFRSSREFFFAPVIEYGPLSRWKEVAGKGQELQDVFWYIKQAIDAYFEGRAFQVTVKAGCLRGVKSANISVDEMITGQVGKVREEEVHEVGSAEVEMVSPLDDSDETDEEDEEELEAFRDDPPTNRRDLVKPDESE